MPKKLTLFGKGFIYPLFLINLSVLLGGISVLCFAAYLAGAASNIISPVGVGSAKWLVIAGLLTIASALTGSLVRVLHNKAWMIVYGLLLATSIGFLVYCQIDYSAIRDDDEATFYKNTERVFNETSERGGPTITQHRIQESFSCCGFENLTQYCSNPVEFRKSLESNFARNKKISERESYDEDNHRELFDSGNLKTHLQDDTCGMKPSLDGDQTFCPDYVFDRMRDEKVIDEEGMFGHGCGDAVAQHYRDVIDKVLLLNLVVILTATICIIQAIVIFAFTDKIDKQKAEYFGDAGLIQSDHTDSKL